MRPLLLAILSSGEFDAPSQIVVQSPTFGRNALQLGFVARDASPQTPRRSTRTINPGETISSVFHAQRRWLRVIVDVTCQPSS